MRLKNKQRGMTPLSLAALLGLLAFAVLVTLTIAPVYLENFNVSSHVQRMGNDSTTASMTREEIRKSLLKRFNIDDVKSVKKEDIYISDSGKGIKIEVEYEVRKKFVGNIDLLISFNESVEVGK